ncbi:hypothetical protein HSB1_26460 [Halogranum salarium B-1]|nr:hypothetical protein HSB1_26460 [Halogranum salarium B-1]
MDVFADHPELVGQSLACSVTTDSMWRLDRFGGPDSALDSLEDALLDSERCEECLSPHTCHCHCEYEVVTESSSTRTVYSYRPELDGCHSVPYLAACELGDGLLFEVSRHENRCRWRILLREGQSVGSLYDRLQEDLREGVTIDLEQLGRPTRWGDGFVTLADLPATQRTTLEAAVDGGYYETPRATTAEALAERLGVPQSTFQYRLQRAEAWLATQFVSETL